MNCTLCELDYLRGHLFETSHFVQMKQLQKAEEKSGKDSLTISELKAKLEDTLKQLNELKTANQTLQHSATQLTGNS